MSTLKESLYEYSEDDINCEPINQHAADCLVRIAEDFAIGFAEYSIAKSLGVSSFKLHEDELQIYKKEKGL